MGRACDVARARRPAVPLAPGMPEARSRRLERGRAGLHRTARSATHAAGPRAGALARRGLRAIALALERDRAADAFRAGGGAAREGPHLLDRRLGRLPGGAR